PPRATNPPWLRRCPGAPCVPPGLPASRGKMMRIGPLSLNPAWPGVRRSAGLVALLALLAVAGCGPTPAADAAHQRGYRGVVLEEPLAKPDFTLTDTGGKPYDFRRETDGKLALLFVGYTNCPDIC